jgi:hypothetical protein
MLKPLTLLTVLFIALGLAFAGLIAKELTAGPRASARRPQPAAGVAATPPPAPEATPAPASPGAGGYTVVASRNLFSPTRSDAPVTPPAPAAPVVVLPKPNLFGVVLQGGVPVAYLEDPTTKRVARYRVGDSVAGGTVKTIEADTVLLARPDGQVTVRLHDPTRPRPAAPATPTPTPSPNAPAGTPPATPPTPTVAPPTGFVPGAGGGGSRRPLPPGMLGRTPPQPVDATTPR